MQIKKILSSLILLNMFYIPCQADILRSLPFPVQASEVPKTLTNTPSSHYALIENVVGNITISASNIELDLNGYTVTGRIIINGANAVVCNGRVIAPAPADNTAADAGVIDIATAASNTRLIDLYISAQDGTVAGVRGARGVDFAVAPDVVIQNCIIIAGRGLVNAVVDGGIGIQGAGDRFLLENSEVSGGNGSNSTNIAITTGSGGQGLNITSGSLCTVISSTVRAGNAGNMDPVLGAGVGNVVLGNGSSTIINTTAFVIQDSTFSGGNGGTVTFNTIGLGGPVTGGAGGAALEVTISTVPSGFISDSRFFGGSSVVLSSTGNLGSNAAVTQGNAREGIFLQTGKVLIEDSMIRGGDSGSLTAPFALGSAAAVTTGVSGGGIVVNSANVELAINNSSMGGGNAAALFPNNIATGGNVVHGIANDGIVNNGGKISIDASIIRGGSVPNIAANVVGSTTTSFTMARGGNGITNTGTTSLLAIENSTIIGGDAAGLSASSNVNNIIPASGGHGFSLSQTSSATLRPEVIISECQIFGGQTGDISATGIIAGLAAVTANNGGNGINISTTNSGFLNVLNCEVSTYRGGDISGTGGAFAITAGNGGRGINLNATGVTAVIASNNTIVQTGRGGNAPLAALSTGGNGGDGIFVAVGVSSAELSKNTIAYTGNAGTGSVAGVAGQAINSLSTSAGPSPSPAMFIYGNFAHDIANATPYNLVAGNVDGFVTGTAYALGTDRLSNIYL